MIEYQQEDRPLRIHTPLGPDVFSVISYTGQESVSGLFCYRVELRSVQQCISLDKLAGQSACLEIGLSSGVSRPVHGVIARVAHCGMDAGAALYSLELRPWLWLLTMNSDCRIFQNRSSPEIVRELVSGFGFNQIAERLQSSYAPREYCVQYNETAFAFLSRLLEEEGIFYFFEHSRNAHQLVLADSPDAWLAPAGPSNAVMAESVQGWIPENLIRSCQVERSVTVGEVATTDYNFETPATNLLAKTASAGSARAVFDFPGRYQKQRDGETATGVQLEALEAEGVVLTAEGACRGLGAGTRFRLEGHPRSDANTAYAVLGIVVNGSQTECEARFSAIPAAVQFRSRRQTRRPSIAGSQTATVTGKAGEEIWTDTYGRVKVKFHWDRAASRDENSSCWVRVSQSWAGKRWGSFFLPRVGQEVVVSFLDGDPDRPLITGSVYNAEQTVPYALPGSQTRSTVKSNSSKGGGGFNELRFDDKAGQEELFVQAQKDMNVVVLNDQSVNVGHQRKVVVETADDLLTVSKGNRSVSVRSGNESHNVKGTRSLEIGGNETHTNDADYTSKVKGTYTLHVDGNLVIEAGGSVTIKAGSGIQMKAGTSIESHAGTSLTNQAGTVLTSKASSEHVVDGGGLVVIKGGLVKIN